MSVQNILKILLFEDDSTMSSLLKTLLTMEGFQVDLYDASEKDIIQYIKSKNPEILIIDIHLRTCNGIEITRSIRKLHEFDDLKIIITSGMHQKDQSLSAGADFFLLKPYFPDELLRMLRV
jgi:DNA-binding response OmpR family regulator